MANLTPTRHAVMSELLLALAEHQCDGVRVEYSSIGFVRAHVVRRHKDRDYTVTFAISILEYRALRVPWQPMARRAVVAAMDKLDRAIRQLVRQ